MTAAGPTGRRPPASSRIDWRAILWQTALVTAIAWLAYQAADNAVQNMRARNIPTDFAFWFRTSGFDINQSLISYSATSTYGRAFLVGLLNTLAVAVVGIVFATIIGFAVGIARLSGNWVVAKLAAVYVEVIRNTPLLLQLLFWYNAVLTPLPGPRQSLALPAMLVQTPGRAALAAGLAAIAAGYGLIRFSRARRELDQVKLFCGSGGSLLIGAGLLTMIFGDQLLGAGTVAGPWSGAVAVVAGEYGYLNNRGLYLPSPSPGRGTSEAIAALAAGLVMALAYRFYARRRQERTGAPGPVLSVGFVLTLAPLALVLLVVGAPVELDRPELRGFNLAGGWRIYPEFFALLLGLSLYTAGFIAEVVRAGILAVPRGQTEAAHSLGLRRRDVLRFVVVPQAMRVIVPPLTNQYLNLTKNSSLAVFIGYPDLVQVFAGTVLNQTGAAVQVIAITMAVYLFLSLVTSVLMNIYNRRVVLVER